MENGRRVVKPMRDQHRFAGKLALYDRPPEILMAGHDRCPVPIQREHIEARLTPVRAILAAMDAILDDPSCTTGTSKAISSSPIRLTTGT